MSTVRSWWEGVYNTWANWKPKRMSEYRPYLTEYFFTALELERPDLAHQLPTKLRAIPRRAEDVEPLLEWLEPRWDSPPKIPGLIHLSQFMNQDEQALLTYEIDDHPWSASLRRRVQQYGCYYNYKEKKVEEKNFIGPMPQWLAILGHRIIYAADLKTAAFDQCIINEYNPGQGIGEHADSEGFGPEVACLSLGAGTTVQFRPWYNAPKSFPTPISGGDLYVMTGPCRHPWTHEILPSSTLGRRLSITFRTIVKG